MDQFYDYVLSFYGPEGIYPMGATLGMVMEATETYLEQNMITFCGDSFDRENVRDIMMRDYGLTMPVRKLA